MANDMNTALDRHYAQTPTVDLADGWEFCKSKVRWKWLVGDAVVKDTETVDLPHCWNEKDAFQDGVAYYRGAGAYRKKFTVPESLNGAGRWVMESEGFYGFGDVWLNGRRVAKVDGEYLGFCLDVSKQLKSGENTVAVRLSNRYRSNVLPGLKLPDFLLYGGLSGRVVLRHIPEVHFERTRLRISSSGVLDGCPELVVLCAVHGLGSKARSVHVRCTVIDPDGERVSSMDSGGDHIGFGAKHDIAPFIIPVDNCRLWSLSDPALYSVRLELIDGDEVLDVMEERVGVRNAEFKAGGFFLNGERVELHGCNRHESMPGFGSALPDSLHEQDAKLIKQTGMNFVRLSHYPQHRAFLDACDREGVLVCAEIATWKSVRGGRWLKSALRQMERMIRRDRNHPGVVIWCMGNESQSRGPYIRMKNLVKHLDPDRPVTYAENHMYRALRKKTHQIPDVWGCNYELDVLEAGRDASHLKSALVTECSNIPTADRGDLAEEMKRAEILEEDWEAIKDKDFVAGYSMWCFNDYATLRKERFIRYSGIFDPWRMPKLSRALLQARCLTEPVLHLYADWSEQAGSKERRVLVVSNCEQVVLTRNGSEIIRIQEQGVTELKIEFEPGELSAVASRDGKEVSTSVKSWGQVAAIEVVIDSADEAASGRPTVGVTLRLVDKDGNLCADYNGSALVKVDGPARSRVYTPTGEIPVWAGLARTFITSTGESGEITVLAESDDLPVASSTLAL